MTENYDRTQDHGVDLTGGADAASAKLDEWGIPDWRAAEAYGKVEDWDTFRWRWEFYRRRKDLRAYFDSLANDTYQNYLDLSKVALTGPVLRPDEPGFLVGCSKEARRVFGYLGIPNPRIGEQPAGAIVPIVGWSHLTRVIDGSKRDDIDGSSGRQIGGRLKNAGVTFTDKQERFFRYSLFDAFPVPLEPHEVAVKFDLESPLEPQIAQARDLLRARQVKRYGKLLKRRHHETKWFGYIRTLDAREAGASWSEIAEIHPATNQTPQAARSIWEQARTLCFNF